MSNWANRLGFRRPNSKIEWTMWIGIGFILLAITWSLLFVKKPVEFSPQIFTGLYITHFLRDIGMGIIASAILVGGLIRLKKDEKKTRGYVGTVGGIILFIFMIGRPALTSTMLSTLHADTFKFSNVLIEKQTDKINNPALSKTDKEYFGKAVAQEKYFQDGSHAEYIDKNGNTVRYQPSTEDIQKREQFLILPRTITILRIEMVLWVVTFIAILAGFIMHNKRKLQD